MLYSKSVTAEKKYGKLKENFETNNDEYFACK